MSKGTFKDTQTSFAGGRFSPELHGRTDFAKYQSAFKDSKNFFVSPEGILLNRAGTEHLAEIVDEESMNFTYLGTPGNIIPFIFGDRDVVLLVFGGDPHEQDDDYPWCCHEDIDPGVWRNGFIYFFAYDHENDIFTRIAPVIREWDWLDDTYTQKGWTGNKSDFPWCVEDTKHLRYVQSGDVITFTFKDAHHGSHGPTWRYGRRPFKLMRMSADSLEWRYELLDISAGAFPSYGGTPRLEEHHELTTATDGLSVIRQQGSLPLEDDEHPARPWTWAVSRIMRTQEGRVYESLPYVIDETVHYRVGEYNAGYSKYGAAGGSFNYVFVSESYMKKYMAPSWWPYMRSHFYYADSVVPAGDAPMPGGTSAWEEKEGADVDPVQSTSVVPDLIVCYTDRPVYIDWRTFTQRPESIPSGSDSIIGTRVYKGRDGYFGFIGEVGPDAHYFIDDGITPDFATPPRVEDNHFLVKGNNSDIEDTPEWPSALCMYEGRLIGASTRMRPGLVVGSAVQAYENFDRSPFPRDADALSFELMSQEWEKIRFLVARTGLYIFTSAGEWVAAGGGERNLLTPNSIAVRQVSGHGSSELQPVVAGDLVVFLDNIGRMPHALAMKGVDSETFDISSVSRYFFRGRSVISWCWAEVPWRTLWAVMDDGKVLSCVLYPEQQLVAWAEHELASGTPLAVASYPANGEHGVAFLVQRNGKYFVERMVSRVLTDVRDSKFLDAHVTYDGRNTDTAKTVKVDSIGGDLVVGHDCTVTFSTGTESVQGSMIDLVVRVLATREKDIYDDETGETYKETETFNVDVCLRSTAALDVYTGELFTPLDSDLDGVETSNFEICKFNIDGLKHLEGETVYALCDGMVIRDLVVTGGRVSLGGEGTGGVYGAVVCVGLRYDCDFESLKVATERGRVRVVKNVLIETYGSRGGYVGQSFDDPRNLEEILVREVEHEYGPVPLKVELTETVIKASYDIEGVIVFRQSEPLPISITAIVRELEYGG